MFRFSDKKSNNHWLYIDNNEIPILLPCLFARYTQVNGMKVERDFLVDQLTLQPYSKLKEKEIGSSTGYKICNRLGHYLEWIDEQNHFSDHINLGMHSALPSEVINTYINEYLIEECSKSEAVANQAVNALNSYYLFLTYFFKNKMKQVGIKPKFRKIARNNNKQSLLVKYILPESRELLYKSASSLLREIVLRNGGELGCRTSENVGFLLADFKSNGKRQNGMLTLFEKLASNPGQMEFKYHLSSIYTKYGRPRTLYIPKHLLQKMYQYYKTERIECDSDHLLVSSVNNKLGLSYQYATDVFRDTVAGLNKEMESTPSLYEDVQWFSYENTYHHLRHSFGTDLFYDACQGQNKKFETITTTSVVYIEVARRMGHKVEGKGAGEVTKTYIHSCGQRERLIKEQAYG
jgi:integrase